MARMMDLPKIGLVSFLIGMLALPHGIAGPLDPIVIPRDTDSYDWDFDQGSGGWVHTATNTPGREGCPATWPNATLVPRDDGQAARIGPEYGDHYDWDPAGHGCNVGVSRVIDLPLATNELTLSFDARALSETAESTVTNAQFAIILGAGVPPNWPSVQDPDRPHLLTDQLVSGGTKDSGWGHYGPYTVSLDMDDTQITIFLYTGDGWARVWLKEAQFDNVDIDLNLRIG